ncbi:hypothetical protein KUCAC02_000952 [Chaenocephalus aceratus]|uniref:Uncharacterized protein n=1 Tax=Chaenocephalus aceratus TaxID=36190 RepID=A0ACB9XUT2_CHAAC|nr:hypothetical protein KUCAC02_000952 [Chaenocephalus aceratus]
MAHCDKNPSWRPRTEGEADRTAVLPPLTADGSITPPSAPPGVADHADVTQSSLSQGGGLHQLLGGGHRQVRGAGRQEEGEHVQ